MYHRFEENKYPSTNIKIKDFKKHLDLIEQNDFNFISHKEFENSINSKNLERKILLTIDDGFKSFYDNAWPYLKKNNIPFILFVSTEPVGKKGYMNWAQIKEIENSDIGMVGHHSHTHEYLIDMKNEDFINDIETASEIFKNKIGYVPNIFSYPFGEFSKFMKDYISKKFDTAFGQHSGIIDKNKDQYELPRFPINEKYGEISRFENLVNYLPLQYNYIIPEDKLIKSKDNPPNMVINFFSKQKNLDKISCYSNEGGTWEKTNFELENNKLNIFFREKFKERRGRINCSLRDIEGWRWLGAQFSIN